DAYNNVATAYTGTVHFASSDPSAGLPLDRAFTAADAGTHNFSARLESHGAQTISASDVNAASMSASASTTVNPLVKWDTATIGNWINKYGSEGYDVVGNASSFPGYGTVNVNGASTWTSSSTDPRALQTVGGTGRVAATWYATNSFTVDVNLSDSQAHYLSLYLMDWSGTNQRQEQVQLSDASTGSVLDTETVSAFSAGIYLVWSISGH